MDTGKATIYSSECFLVFKVYRSPDGSAVLDASVTGIEIAKTVGIALPKLGKPREIEKRFSVTRIRGEGMPGLTELFPVFEVVQRSDNTAKLEPSMMGIEAGEVAIIVLTTPDTQKKFLLVRTG